MYLDVKIKRGNNFVVLAVPCSDWFLSFDSVFNAFLFHGGVHQSARLDHLLSASIFLSIHSYFYIRVCKPDFSQDVVVLIYVCLWYPYKLHQQILAVFSPTGKHAPRSMIVVIRMYMASTGINIKVWCKIEAPGWFGHISRVKEMHMNHYSELVITQGKLFA
jgi:hypothetical protein